MKKMFIILGIAFALIIGGWNIANWWTSMEEANKIAYAEHLKEQEIADAKRDIYTKIQAYEINQLLSQNEEAGLYD